MNISFAVDNHIETYNDIEQSYDFIVESLKAYLRAGFLNNVKTQVGCYEIVLETFFSEEEDELDHYLARITVDSLFYKETFHYLIGMNGDKDVIDIVDLNEEDFIYEVGLVSNEPEEDEDNIYTQDINQGKIFKVFLGVSE